MLKALAASAALAFSAAGFAQTTTTTTPSLTPAAQQVQLLAPQLLAFAGSVGNFDSLVNGLTSGAPVTLTTVESNGVVQIVTFVPGTTLSALDAARQLEAARQSLITRGVATPTAQQLAVSLVGGTLPTLAGSSAITGVLPGTSGTTIPVQVRNEIASVPVSPAAGALSLSAADLQALRDGLARGTAVTLSGTTTPAGVSPGTTFSAPGGPMNAFEVDQALQLASALLAQQGILTPTPDQLRVALVGGTLTGVNGANIPVRGVLQGRVRSTSESPTASTSASPVFGTSNTPPTTAAVPTPAPAPAATVPVAPVILPGGSTAEGATFVPRASTAEGANRVRPPTRPGG